MNKVWVGIIIIVTIILVIRFVACRLFTKCEILNDMLREMAPDGAYRYSQGRVYLFLSLLAYFVTLGFMTSKGLKPNINIDSGTMTQIIEALQWSIALMAGYVFGSKGLEALKIIMMKKETPTKNTPTEGGEQQ
jgi:hypothetical protein